MRIARLVLVMLVVCGLGVYGQGPPGGAKAADKEDKRKTRSKGTLCVARTKDGGQCKRKVADGGQYCWQHGGRKKA